MKTSSKIFTGIFLTPIIIPLIVAATIIYKVKSGKVERDTFDVTAYEAQYFPQAKHIVARGFDNLEIETGDSLEVDIYNSYDVMAKIQMQGDTLLLRGDTVRAVKRTHNNVILSDTTTDHTSRKVVLKVPSGFPVIIRDSRADLLLKGDNTPDVNLELINSTLSGNAQPIGSASPMGQLSIKATATVLNFGDWDIRGLQLDLQSESKASLGASMFGTFTLKIDPTSSISLDGNQLKKLSPAK